MKKWLFIMMILSSMILVWCTNPTANTEPTETSSRSTDDKNTLAQCLSEKGAIMYGTERCSHCNAQKALFGPEAFKKVQFVDCEAEKNTCWLAGVTGYPTWIFDDKSQLMGQQTLETLANKAGCEI